MTSYTISNKVNFEEVPGFEPDDPTIQFPTIIGNIDFSFIVTIETNPPQEEGGGGSWTLIATTCISHPDFVITFPVSVDSVSIARDMSIEVFPGERFETVRYGYDGEGDEMIAANSAAYPSFPENPNDISFDANTEPAANTEFIANTALDDGGLGVLDLNTSIFPTGNETYGLFETFKEEDALSADPDSSIYAYIVPPIRERSESYTFVSFWRNDSTDEVVEVITIYPQDFQWSWVPGQSITETLVDRSKF